MEHVQTKQEAGSIIQAAAISIPEKKNYSITLYFGETLTTIINASVVASWVMKTGFAESDFEFSLLWLYF